MEPNGTKKDPKKHVRQTGPGPARVFFAKQSEEFCQQHRSREPHCRCRPRQDPPSGVMGEGDFVGDYGSVQDRNAERYDLL